MANLPAGGPDTLKTDEVSISSRGMLTSVSVRALGARRAPEAWPRQAKRASSSLRASRTLHLAAQQKIIYVEKVRLTLQPVGKRRTLRPGTGQKVYAVTTAWAGGPRRPVLFTFSKPGESTP